MAQHTRLMTNKIPPALREMLAEQAGMVSRRQVLRAGLARSTIDSKVRHGLWQQVHLGVYATFTGNIAWEARLWGAVLYAGPGALLSHETAAEILRLTDRRLAVIQVAIPESRRVRAPQGMQIHRSSVDYPRWRPLRGIPPHTFYADTIIDLVAAADNRDDVVAWISRGVARRLVTEAELKAAVAARGRLRWRDQLDEIIGTVAGGSHFPLEYRYARDVERAHGLPAATRQAKFIMPEGTRGFRDRCYEKFGLVVELDGVGYHPAEQRGRDQARDNEVAAAIGATLRYGWADVTAAPCKTAAQVYRALRKRGYQGGVRACSPGCQAVLAALRAPDPGDPAAGEKQRIKMRASASSTGR